LVEPYLEDAPFQELCGDIAMGKATPSIGVIDSICTQSLNLTPTSSPLLLTTPSHLYAFYEYLGDIRRSHSTFNPCCAYLEDVPREFMWSTFFYHGFDFSMASDEFKMRPTLFAPFLLVLLFTSFYDACYNI